MTDREKLELQMLGLDPNKINVKAGNAAMAQITPNTGREAEALAALVAEQKSAMGMPEAGPASTQERVQIREKMLERLMGLDNATEAEKKLMMGGS